jgi:hypothetical protein
MKSAYHLPCQDCIRKVSGSRIHVSRRFANQIQLDLPHCGAKAERQGVVVGGCSDPRNRHRITDGQGFGAKVR